MKICLENFQECILDVFRAEFSNKIMPTATKVCKTSFISGLEPFTTFQGFQQNGSISYKVTVLLLTTNLPQSTLSGYLYIQGLTDKFPSLTTFFDGEIVGGKYSFLTNRYQADKLVDQQHWSRFEEFDEKYFEEYEPGGNVVFMVPIHVTLEVT
jgi:Vacuolar import and degradation protein